MTALPSSPLIRKAKQMPGTPRSKSQRPKRRAAVGRPRFGAEVMDVRIPFRVTSVQKVYLERAAREQGMSEAALIRAALDHYFAYLDRASRSKGSRVSA